MKRQRIKESISKYPIRSINISATISVSIGKIFASWYYNKREALATGFFIKIKKDKDSDLYQYFFVTCEHVITEEIIEDGYQDIEIAYHLESVYLSIDLDRNERFIKEYQTSYNVDITIIELKENEVPIQYFLEPDYNMSDNYEQYIGKKIIIHQFPKGLEQCFSEGKISGISKEKREMFYKVSTEEGSSGSPVIVKDTNLVIGVHKEGFKYENCANFFDVVLNDNERKNCVYYIREKIFNKKIINYTKQGVLDIKTKDKRVYHDKTKKYKIFLNKVYDDDKYDLRIINTYTNTEYNKQLYSNGEDIFELFDLNAYNFIIIEEEDLELNVDFNHRYYLEREMEDRELESEINYPSLLENKFYNKPIKESKKIPQKKIMINKFKNLSINSYNDELENYPSKNYEEYKKNHPKPYKTSENKEKIDYEKSFESKDNNFKDNKSNSTETYSYKKNDDFCNIW